MREHGVLDRVMLIYEAVMRKFGSNEDFDPAVITDSASIVREFSACRASCLPRQRAMPILTGARQ